MLTGNTRYKSDWLGRFILQVEHRVEIPYDCIFHPKYLVSIFYPEFKLVWRNATKEDLISFETVYRGYRDAVR